LNLRPAGDACCTTSRFQFPFRSRIAPRRKPWENALRPEYQIVGFDLRIDKSDFPIVGMDLTSGSTSELALHKLPESFGSNIASVITATGRDFPPRP
jgi:hypothetical protein